MTDSNGIIPTQQDSIMIQPRHSERFFFVLAGLLFLFAALALYAATGYIAYEESRQGLVLKITEGSPTQSRPLNDQQTIQFFAQVVQFFAPPLMTFISAIICTAVGARLLKSAGAVSSRVISVEDMDLLGPAIAKGNESAVTQYIRLSSLTGITGTFTKIGLTGLPLATIFLTIFLALLGVFVDQFLDLAKLTLGAFLGSFVQRQSDPSSRPPQELERKN